MNKTTIISFFDSPEARMISLKEGKQRTVSEREIGNIHEVIAYEHFKFLGKSLNQPLKQVIGK